MSLRHLGVGVKQVASEEALPAALEASRSASRGFERIEGTSEGTPVGGALKRAIDIAIALLALVAALPLMALVAVLIKVAMGGSVFFAHERVGFGGRRFRCYKFRSMIPDGDRVLEDYLSRHPEHRRAWQLHQKLPVDPRTTSLGTILRRASLDELPQLVNVLRGDMSIVGPRPVTPTELARYGVHRQHYLKARPGLTGLWQVSGRNLLGYRTRVMLDSAYVRSWSLALDGWIILRTIPALLSPHETS